MFHDLHHIAARVLLEDFWEGDRSQGTHLGLVSFDRVVDPRRDGNRVGVPARGADLTCLSCVHRVVIACFMRALFDNNSEVVAYFAIV